MYEFAVTPGLSVSFQRYPQPPSGVVTALARSCGALPLIETGLRQLAIPAPSGEAFWIGLITGSRRSWRVSATAHLRSGEHVDILTATHPTETGNVPPGRPGTALPDATNPGTITVPPGHGIAGILRDDAIWWALTRDARNTPAPETTSLALWMQDPDGQNTTSLHVDVVTVAGFLAAGGQHPQPLDPLAVYRGERLP
jgi:hypothetical protein